MYSDPSLRTFLQGFRAHIRLARAKNSRPNSLMVLYQGSDITQLLQLQSSIVDGACTSPSKAILLEDAATQTLAPLHQLKEKEVAFPLREYLKTCII